MEAHHPGLKRSLEADLDRMHVFVFVFTAAERAAVVTGDCIFEHMADLPAFHSQQFLGPVANVVDGGLLGPAIFEGVGADHGVVSEVGVFDGEVVVGSGDVELALPENVADCVQDVEDAYVGFVALLDHVAARSQQDQHK